jgi:hypothetical protein
MQVESKSAVVPADISADVEEIVKAIKSAAEQQGQSADDAIRIVRPQGRGMVPGGLETVILIVGSGATWFTKKWIDAFVWPRIAEVVKKPSEQAIDFVLSRIPSIGTEHPQGQRDAERS